MSVDLNIYPVNNDSATMYKLVTPVAEPLPDLKNNFVLSILGGRGSGKGVLLMNMLYRKEMFNILENVKNFHYFSPTGLSDRTCAPVREYNNPSIHLKYDDNIIRDITLYQNSYQEEDRPKCIICIDDNVGTKCKALNNLVTRARHSNTSIIYVSQALKQINKCVRSNCTDVVIFKTYNAKEYENIYEEYGSLFGSRKYFNKMYRYCTRKKYDFMFLKIACNPPQAFKGFNENITDKFPREKDDFNFDEPKEEPKPLPEIEEVEEVEE
tara:strand:- start:1573 stop:2376 length:804 start_codon:yes stop_codon:yes gene_type:complete